MDADWSVELGADDPALELPWSSPDGVQAYVDLSNDLQRLSEIPEAVQYPPMMSFLVGLNASRLQLSPWLSAKCDVWVDNEVGAATDFWPHTCHWRVGSYVDIVRREESQRFAFDQHERWMTAATACLHRFPDGPYSCEFVLRRCYFHLDADSSESTPGFFLTVYLNGYGFEKVHAEGAWKGGLDRVSHALLTVTL